MKIPIVFLLLILIFTGINGYTKDHLNLDNDLIKVEVITSKGRMVISLYSKTIKHRTNFLKLVNNKFYEGVLFHRIIKGFMAQAGDPNSKISGFEGQLGNESEGETISAEIFIEYYHKKGVLAAARMPDDVNPLKESSGSQFYIVQGKTHTLEELKNTELKIQQQRERELLNYFFQNPVNESYLIKARRCQQQNMQDSLNLLLEEIRPIAFNNHKPFQFSDNAIKDYIKIGGAPHLDGGYTVFGQIIEGLQIIDEICAVTTIQADRPKEDLKIISMQIIND